MHESGHGSSHQKRSARISRIANTIAFPPLRGAGQGGDGGRSEPHPTHHRTLERKKRSASGTIELHAASTNSADTWLCRIEQTSRCTPELGQHTKPSPTQAKETNMSKEQEN